MNHIKLTPNTNLSIIPLWHGLFGLHYYLNGRKKQAIFFLMSYFIFPIWLTWIVYNFWKISEHNRAQVDQEKNTLEEALNAPIQLIKRFKNNSVDHLSESIQDVDETELAELKIHIKSNLDQISNNQRID